MNIFPSLAEAEDETAVGSAAEYTDIKWDSAAGSGIYRGGKPVIATGIEAIAGWAARALQTVRGRCPGVSADYGSELDALIGMPYTVEVKQSEAARYISDALLTNEYIKSVSVTDVGFEDDRLTIAAQLTTVYGEADINVSV